MSVASASVRFLVPLTTSRLSELLRRAVRDVLLVPAAF